MVFPVIHSTLDPNALKDEVVRRYDLPTPVRCQLINRANNDFYEVRAGDQRYALRVAKANFRTREAYHYESTYVHHLYTQGCQVPAPIPAKDGSFLFEVEAPEGTRTLTLMRWLEGTVFSKDLSVEEAHDIGKTLATLHLAGASFTPDTPRHLSATAMIDERMPLLLAMLESDPAHRAFYEQATALVKKGYAALQGADVPRGPVHGDFQYANVMRTTDGTFAALDFDSCGFGYLAEDIFTFLWRSDLDIKNQTLNDAFIRGYTETRPLEAIEQSNLGLFRVARDLVMSSTFAMLINRIGPVPGFDGDFAPFTALAKTHLAQSGLQ
jgi:Ser/Thr protein kinase RdoA (MazF antagonist)